MTSIPTYFGRPIEPRIRPLVEAMNVAGICRTIASCEGHRRWHSVRPPYVYFQASLSFAAAVNRFVYGDLCRKLPALRYPWHVRGMFNERDELCFGLSVPEMERHPSSPLTWLTWSRSDLDADFATLRRLVQDALAEIRKNDVPEVKQCGDRQSQVQKCRTQRRELFHLLRAHPARRIRGLAYRAYQRRGADPCFAIPAFHQRHDSSPSMRDKGIHSIPGIMMEGDTHGL